jgi:hypothetical protein
MSLRSLRRCPFLLLVICLAARPAAGQDACMSSIALNDLVTKAVSVMSQEHDPIKFRTQWNLIVTTGLFAAAVDPGVTDELIRDIRTLDIAEAETSRTDKQTGAGAESTGTTTLVEKVGLPRLLSMAIENNAIQQESDGTSLTLRSTPYALLLFLTGKPDTAETYQEFTATTSNTRDPGFAIGLPLIGLAANFALNEEQNKAPDDLNFDQFSSFSAKWQFWGDRSPRSEAFQQAWKADVQGAIQDELNAAGKAIDKLFENPQPSGAELTRRSKLLLEQLTTSFRAQLASVPANQPVDGETQKAMVAEAMREIDAQICVPASDPGETGNEIISGDTRSELAELARRYYVAKLARGQARQRFLELIDTWNKNPGGSLAYSLHRIDGGSDFSEVKLLFQGSSDDIFPNTTAGLNLSFNGLVSINHQPDHSMGQDSLRDYGATLGVEKNVPNAITGFLQKESLGEIEIGLNGEVKQLEESNDVLGAVQLRFSVPIYWGLDLPLSFSWASRTEEKDDDVFRVSVGGLFDSDKLEALWKLGNSDRS